MLPNPPFFPNLWSANINNLCRNSVKELSLYHTLKCSNPYILANCWCKLLKFQTLIIWSNKIHSLKYLRSQDCKIRVCGKDSISLIIFNKETLVSLFYKHICRGSLLRTETKVHLKFYSCSGSPDSNKL